jgi:hypothetical protein
LHRILQEVIETGTSLTVAFGGPARREPGHPTSFSDAITAVRRDLWVEAAFSPSGHREPFEKLGRPLRRILLQGLAPAA